MSGTYCQSSRHEAVSFAATLIWFFIHELLHLCSLRHLATTDPYVADEAEVYEPAKRYYAEIMMPFLQNIKRHLERIKGLKVDLIATSPRPALSQARVHPSRLPGLSLGRCEEPGGTAPRW